MRWEPSLTARVPDVVGEPRSINTYPHRGIVPESEEDEDEDEDEGWPIIQSLTSSYVTGHLGTYASLSPSLVLSLLRPLDRRRVFPPSSSRFAGIIEVGRLDDGEAPKGVLPQIKYIQHTRFRMYLKSQIFSASKPYRNDLGLYIEVEEGRQDHREEVYGTAGHGSQIEDRTIMRH